MATLADPTWVKYWIELGDVHILDPRPPAQYAEGHLPGAVNLPLERILNAGGFLLPVSRMAQAFGEAGLDESKRSLVYDAADGRRGAMMAWVLEYLGRGEVALCALLYEGWARQGFVVSTEPVTPQPRQFQAAVSPGKRITLEELRAGEDVKLLDLRSPEERRDAGGSLPGSINLPWTELLGSDDYLLGSDTDLWLRMKALGMSRMDTVAAYSATGLSASIGYQALKRAGCGARLLDLGPGS